MYFNEFSRTLFIAKSDASYPILWGNFNYRFRFATVVLATCMFVIRSSGCSMNTACSVIFTSGMEHGPLIFFNAWLLDLNGPSWNHVMKNTRMDNTTTHLTPYNVISFNWLTTLTGLQILSTGYGELILKPQLVIFRTQMFLLFQECNGR